MYYAIDVSVSLHRESTDSLISIQCSSVCLLLKLCAAEPIHSVLGMVATKECNYKC